MALYRNIAGFERLGLLTHFDSTSTGGDSFTTSPTVSFDSFSSAMTTLHDFDTTQPVTVVAEPVIDTGDVFTATDSYTSDVPTGGVVYPTDFSAAMAQIHDFYPTEQPVSTTSFGDAMTDIHDFTPTGPTVSLDTFSNTMEDVHASVDPASQSPANDVGVLLTVGGLVVTMLKGESLFPKKRKLIFLGALAALYFELSD